MQTEGQRTVNAVILCREQRAIVSICPPRFRVAQLFGARKFPLRQGLWIEDLRTPPGQECSNGSMILLAVVLWRTFWIDRRWFIWAGPAIRDETSQDQNS